MAQYDLHLLQNVAAAGYEFKEVAVNFLQGHLLTADASHNPVSLTPGGVGQVLSINASGDLEWITLAGGHTQNTDTGTNSTTFQLDNDGYKIELTAESANKGSIKTAGGAAYADFQVNDLTCNNLTVNGTTTTINSTTLTVDDKNIELANGNSTDAGADGGGITLKGATDKTILWLDATDSWTFNQNVDISSGMTYRIGGTTVLSSTQVLGKTLGTMAEADTSEYVPVIALPSANSMVVGDGVGGVGTLTIAEQKVVGRKTGGNLAALSGSEIMNCIWTSAPVSPASPGTTGSVAYDGNFLYICTATNTWKRLGMATTWS